MKPPTSPTEKFIMLGLLLRGKTLVKDISIMADRKNAPGNLYSKIKKLDKLGFVTKSIFEQNKTMNVVELTSKGYQYLKDIGMWR